MSKLILQLLYTLFLRVLGNLVRPFSLRLACKVMVHANELLSKLEEVGDAMLAEKGLVRSKKS